MNIFISAEAFGIRPRIQSMTKNSIVLKGDNGERIFCHRQIFNRIMADPGIQVRVVPVTMPSGMQTYWLEALLPMRTMFEPCFV